MLTFISTNFKVSTSVQKAYQENVDEFDIRKQIALTIRREMSKKA